MPLKLFLATIANADTESSVHYLLRMDHIHDILAKFEPNHMVQSVQNFELLDKNPSFEKNHFWQRIDAILQDVSVAETIV